MGQEVDFNIKGLIKIPIGNFDYYITTTHVSVLIVMLTLIGFALYANRQFKKFKEVPTGFQNFVELLVEIVEKFAKLIMGPHSKRFSSYIGTLFSFILVSNLSGIFTLRPPTADYGTTLGIALITFFMVQVNAIKTKKPGGYIKGFFEPMPLLFPLNVIGEIANPVSLSFRLFGNIMGGTILMGLFYAMIPKFVQFGIPALLHFYFDVFSSVMQSFVFCMLSMVFITGALDE